MSEIEISDAPESVTHFRSVAPATGQPVGGVFAVHEIADVATACAAADAAFDVYRETDPEARAAFLERIGDEIHAIGDDLIVTAMRESGLLRARLESERGRTVGQLRLFANVVRRGGWMGLRIDPALPNRASLPRPDLRLRMIPLGPVAVFGASNFPLLFSTIGGDTASALAAGCPVVVKGHQAHPATSAMVAHAIRTAVDACGMPEGVFRHLVGPDNILVPALVQDAKIAAVGFTGSRGGGTAIVTLAQTRSVPIPVFVKMSSINPVILLPEAVMARGEPLGHRFVASLAMGAGQFCTNPGLVIAIEGDGLDAFVSAVNLRLTQEPTPTKRTGGIKVAFEQDVTVLTSHPAVNEIARGNVGKGVAQGQVAFFETTAYEFLSDASLGHNLVGGSSLLVRCCDEAELHAVIHTAEDYLIATIQMDAGDTELAARLIPILERKAGRILANGWPSGFEVEHELVHGETFPPSFDGHSTSVGALAIDRFLRPVSYQNLAGELLPESLRDDTVAARPIDGAPAC